MVPIFVLAGLFLRAVEKVLSKILPSSKNKKPPFMDQVNSGKLKYCSYESLVLP